MHQNARVIVTEPSGETSTLNRLTGDNDRVRGCAPERQSEEKEKLLALASDIAERWRPIFSDSRVSVERVDDQEEPRGRIGGPSRSSRRTMALRTDRRGSWT
jgi:hypothetical protein